MAACGATHAHELALVLEAQGLPHVHTPLPAIAQAFVDHGGLVHKVYVIGQQVLARTGHDLMHDVLRQMWELKQMSR